jgi:hypothetical protein
MVTKYNDLVKQALALGIDYIAMKELTDDASLEAAGKALANKIETAEAAPKPEENPNNPLPIDDEVAQFEQFFQGKPAATA